MANLPKKIEDKLNEGRTYRKVSKIEARASEDGSKIVEGYATIFNSPYTLWSYDGYTVMEQVDSRAFDECDMSDVIMQYDHEGRVFARNKNNTLIVRTDDTGLYTEADLSGTELGGQIYEEIAGGYTDKMSFGFMVAEDKREVTEDRETGQVTVLRTITKISKLYDVSAVSIPANDATSISARNYGEGVIAEIIEEVEKRAKQQQRIKILLEVSKCLKKSKS